MFILIICTVGGSPEPLIESLKHWRPQRIIFFPSPETRNFIEEKILPLARAEDAPLPPGCYDTYPILDSQDFTACVRRMREARDRIQEWLGRGPEYQVVFDFTGGTKCMTAALALTAHRWPGRFSYIGASAVGEAGRDKQGVGIVVSGKEQVLHFQNPWDALGYQVVEEAVTLCERGDHGSAAAIVAAARDKTTDPTVKRELATLTSLAEACAAWDRFDHQNAHKRLKDVQTNLNDFISLFGRPVRDYLTAWIERSLPLLRTLKDSRTVTPALINDLLANARRRADEGRWDDAVARLYRAVEALAQLRLRAKYGIEDTGRTPLANLPPDLQEKWAAKAGRDGCVKIGLQDAYALLKAWGDDLAERFAALGWDKVEVAEKENNKNISPLAARNDSILAHGFTPVKEKVFRRLWDGCLKLAQVDPDDLPHFPKLGGR